MKRTRITATDTGDGNITIVEIRNVASPIEIKKEFGIEVQRDYMHSNKYPYYFRSMNKDSTEITIVGKCYNRKSCVKIDTPWILSKEMFQEMVSLLKKSGERLTEAKDAVKKYKTFEVVI